MESVRERERDRKQREEDKEVTDRESDKKGDGGSHQEIRCKQQLVL